MSFFNKSRCTKITGGTFKNKYTTTNVQNINNSGPSGIDILFEASYPDAAFDSSARDRPPRCWPGTRARCIEFITNWSGLSWVDHPLPILWIDGLAGVGKSAVAQTCSEKLKPLGRLGAAFFFSTLDKRDKHSRFFPTVSYQLCTEFPDYRDLVDQKVFRDKTLVDKMMVSQFKQLIVEPLQELERRGKGIGKRTIIVDGLDECADPDAQCEIIDIIAESVREHTTPLCWAIFSRPEPKIQATFFKPTVSPFFGQRSLPISREVDAEIELFLRDGFRDILRRHNLPGSPLSTWPSDDDTRILVAASGGLFIYAGTILLFVDQADSALGPGGLLREVLALIKGTFNVENSSDWPFARLDMFYRHIMGRIPAKSLPSLHLLLGSMLYAPYDIDELEQHKGQGAMILGNMLQLSELDFRTLCGKFHAIIRISDCPPLASHEFTDDAFYDSELPSCTLYWLLEFVQDRLGGAVHFHHKSFVEFLRNPSRSSNFCLETPTAYNCLVRHCLQQELRYEESYCLGDTGVMLAPGVLNSATSLSWSYSNELVNSILKGFSYFRAANIVDRARFELEDSELEPGIRKQISTLGSHSMYFWFRTYLFPNCISEVIHYGASAMAKVTPGVEVYRVPPSTFDKFDVFMFKENIATSLERNRCRPYSPPLEFRHRARLHAMTSSAEWGLYVFGQDADQLFWYWEFDLKKCYYQAFRSTDLFKGQKTFQEQASLWSADDRVGVSHND